MSASLPRNVSQLPTFIAAEWCYVIVDHLDVYVCKSATKCKLIANLHPNRFSDLVIAAEKLYFLRRRLMSFRFDGSYMARCSRFSLSLSFSFSLSLSLSLSIYLFFLSLCSMCVCLSLPGMRLHVSVSPIRWPSNND